MGVVRAERFAAQAAIFRAEDVASQLDEGERLVRVAGDNDRAKLELVSQLLSRHAEAPTDFATRRKHLELDTPAHLEVKTDPRAGLRLETE